VRIVRFAVPPIGATLPGIAWPPIPAGRAATLANLVHELDRTQWLPPEAIVAAQFRQLRVLARDLTVAVPVFRQRLDRAGLRPDDLGTSEGLARLPPLSREELVAAGEAAFATRVPRGHEPIVQANTSGSTGLPVTVRRTEVTRLLWDALTLRDYLSRGVDLRGKLLVHRFAVKSPLTRSHWGSPASGLYLSGPSVGVPLFEPIDALAARLEQFGPDVLIAYPSVLDRLMLHFERLGRRPPQVDFVHTISESLPAVIRTAATARFGATVWEDYSCEEIGYVATGCPDGDGLHVAAEAALVEVLDDADRPCAVGGVGRIVVTDLHNLATPLVRYDLGDYAEVAAPCRCGRGLPTLRRILGRERNRVRLPDGRWHWPEFDSLIAYQEVAPVDQFQVLQRRDDTLEVVAVGPRPPSQEEEQAFAERLHGTLGHPFPLRFVWRTEPIARTRGGKFEPFRREAPAR
jgi:phenylacetate-coenzyme A ligase PaaK-like adenylate-forming protein